jgi:hypothetical protein
MTTLPEHKKAGKYTFKLVRDTNSGKIIIRNEYQLARFTIHVNAQGYIVSKKMVTKKGEKPALYAMYISTTIVPAAERKLEMSKMHGKMEGVGGLNTNTALNPGCRAAFRGKSGEGCNPTICKSCYSMKGLVEGKSGNPPKATSMAMLTRNTRLLTQGPLANVPKVSQTFFRFSAEGDLHNEQHLLNFFAIARANPGTHFTLWTKRHAIVAKVLGSHPKPHNLFLIQSSLRVNTPEKKLPGYSKVFTVYTPEYLKKHPEIKINCGAKSCMSCQLCYTTNGTTIVNERLKGNHKKGKSP